MTENVRKLVGVAAMAVLVVVGVVATSGGDDDVDFTRNLAADLIFTAAFDELPEAQQARAGNSFMQRAAPKSVDTRPINKTNNQFRPIWQVPKTSIVAATGANGLSTGKASVLEGRGVDGKGGTSSLIMDSRQVGVVSGQDIEAIGGVEGVADRLGQCVGSSFPSVIDNSRATTVVLLVVTAFTTPADEQLGSWTVDCNPFREHEPLALAECMESKVGDVLLKSHTEAMAADCVATVMPALLPERAKRLGTYWQTQQQLVGTD